MSRSLSFALLLIVCSFAHAPAGTPLSRETVRAQLREEFLRGDSSVQTSPLAPARARKSVGLAVLYSLALPGMGELYAGGFSSGKYFLIADGVLWLTYVFVDLQGTSMRNDARAFATARAGISAGGKTDQFFVDIGNFLSVDEYNEKKLRDREPGKLYDPAAGYSWRWANEVERSDYRTQRLASENMFNNRKFVAAALLLNRVASAINAARAAVATNSVLDHVDLGASVLGGPGRAHGVAINLVAHF